MTVFHTIAYNSFRTILTGTVLALFPGAIAIAQPSGDDAIPNPRSRPSLESYSLPPGPDSAADRNVFQGPVDAEIPVIEPPVVSPRTAPAKAPPEPANPAAGPAPTDSSTDRAQPPIRQNPVRTEVPEKISPPTQDPPEASPVTVREEPVDTTRVPTAGIGSVPSPSKALPEPPSATAQNSWYPLGVAALFFILLGAMFLWRARRASRERPATTKADGMTTGQTQPVTKPPEPLRPVPAIALSFQPHSANATLLNAVVGFELALSNHSNEGLTGIRVHGAMVQAEKHGAGDRLSPDLSLLREVPDLQAGETEKIRAEFRVPLNSIRPIMFRSQALFVPQVQISIEFTDGAGFQHFQTAAYLVGQEHQPPRLKMAPFRLDLGPRSFAPIGHRPLAAG